MADNKWNRFFAFFKVYAISINIKVNKFNIHHSGKASKF